MARVIRAHANPETLREAGLDNAVGVVAGTDDDHVNLGILTSVAAIRPGVFTIARQNRHENQLAFDAVDANLVLQSSLTTARRVLKHLISPQVQIFIEYLRGRGEDICEQTVERLSESIGEQPPHLWHLRLEADTAGAVCERLAAGLPLRLGELRRDPHRLDGVLPCLAFSILRRDGLVMLPGDDLELAEGDDILFCGTEASETLLTASANNVYTLDYLITGIDQPRGYVFRWLQQQVPSAG